MDNEGYSNLKDSVKVRGKGGKGKGGKGGKGSKQDGEETVETSSSTILHRKVDEYLILPSRDDSSIFNNKYFQVAGAILGLILIFFLVLK